MAGVGRLGRVRGGVVEPASALVVPSSEGFLVVMKFHVKVRVKVNVKARVNVKWNCARICWAQLHIVPSIAQYYILYKHRNPNMNNKDHLVGRLTTWYQEYQYQECLVIHPVVL